VQQDIAPITTVYDGIAFGKRALDGVLKQQAAGSGCTEPRIVAEPTDVPLRSEQGQHYRKERNHA
jgi:hypothetical protein